MRRVAFVFAGGFCGALARYLLAPAVLAFARPIAPGAQLGIPYDIVFINLTGAFALGLLYGLVEKRAALAPDIGLLLGTGFLGAYTTFSSLALGGYTLLSSGAVLLGEVYLLGTSVLGIVCAANGVAVAGRIIERRRSARTTRASRARRVSSPLEGEPQRTQQPSR